MQGESISVPSVSGKSVEDAKRTLRKAQLEPVVSGDQVYATYAPQGTVAYSYPGTGASVYPGQRVVVYVSNGAPPVPTPQPQPSQPPEAPEPETTLGPGAGDQPSIPPGQQQPERR